jgi:hexosaminidase
VLSLLVAASLARPLLGPNTPLHSGDVIAFFGDSITYQGGYLGILSDRLQHSPNTRRLLVSLVKRGIDGGKSNDLRDGVQNLYGCKQAPFAQVLEHDNPAVAVIEIGINDVWHGVHGNPPEAYEHNLRQLVAIAKQHHVPLVLATPSIIGERPQGQNPLDEKLDLYASIVKKVARDTHSAVADTRSAFFSYLAQHPHAKGAPDDRGVLTYDSVHMLPAGNMLLANAFQSGIEHALANRRPSATGWIPASNLGPNPCLPLVPSPQSVVPLSGSLRLSNPTVFAKDRLLAMLLSAELQAKTDVAPRFAKERSASIRLVLMPGFAPEAYRLQIGQTVTVSASTNQGLTWGLVSLVQLAKTKHHDLIFPRLTIEDAPAKPYRGLMIDVARQYHSIDNLKQVVLLCHLNKLNYLQLHLTDDQSFTFPSQAFPKINQFNQHGGPSYTVEELKGLVSFAARRGVAIVPEFDIPGHSATLNRAMPELFKITGTKPYEHHATINFASPKVLAAVDTLIGEMCDVFSTSPYFHMGGDEADIEFADQNADFQAAFKQFRLPAKSQQEIFRRFMGQVDAMVKRRGKKLLVWEGFGRDPDSKFPIPSDVQVMAFENAYYLPGDLPADGYRIINASWTPLYVVKRHVWPARAIYNWDLTQFGKFANVYKAAEFLRSTDLRSIQGAQACSWEGPEELEIENLRRLVPAMAERIWNPGLGATFQNFTKRAQAQEPLLDRLVHPVLIKNAALDANDPDGFDVPCFTKPLRVTLTTQQAGLIRYTLDGKPVTVESPVYKGPISLKTTTTVRTANFSVGGQKQGFESSRAYYFVPAVKHNLASGKKVTVSGGTQGPQTPNLVVDDNLDLHSSWWAAPAPQWLQIDLGKVQPVSRIEVFPYWDGRRYYQYTVEVSPDGRSWAMVADRSQNTQPANQQGDQIVFSPTPARYVKVNMLKGSANEGVHLIEVRVWP